jgi:hypothetical protein
MTAAGNRLAWVLSLALAAAGALASHGLAYWIVEPDSERRHHLLEETGHSYLNLELAGSLLAALVVVGFAGCVLAGARRRDAAPLWIFALAPPLGFALQEHAELVLHYHAFGRSPVLTPVFLVGLGLQIPFALVALLAARTLLAAAGALSRRLGSPPHFRLAPDASLELAVSNWQPAAPTLVGARGQRAPPAAFAL